MCFRDHGFPIRAGVPFEGTLARFAGNRKPEETALPLKSGMAWRTRRDSSSEISPRDKEKEKGGEEGEKSRAFLRLLNGRVRLLVLLGVFDIHTAIHVFGARMYGILLTSLRHFLVDDTLLVILLVLVAGRDVRLASGADATRSLLVAATPRCNKQRHDRSRQMCVCGLSFLSHFALFRFALQPFASRPANSPSVSTIAVNRRLSRLRVDTVRRLPVLRRSRTITNTFLLYLYFANDEGRSFSIDDVTLIIKYEET